MCLTQKQNSAGHVFYPGWLFTCFIVIFQVPCALLVQQMSSTFPAWRPLHTASLLAEAIYSQLQVKDQGGNMEKADYKDVKMHK